MQHKTDPSKLYVFYDGECGFCNHWVQWILKNDHQDKFLFSALQSSFAQDFLKQRNLHQKNFDTIYLWKPNAYYLTKSHAISKIAYELGGKYQLLSRLNIFPRILSDAVYDQVAKRRKNIAVQTCLIPSETEREKFID